MRETVQTINTEDNLDSMSAIDTSANVIMGDDELNMDAFHNSFIIDEKMKIQNEKKKDQDKDQNPEEVKEEVKYVFNGVEMSEDQISLMIFLSEKSNPFSVTMFLHSFFCHLMSFFITFPLTVMVMYVMEGFDSHLAYNWQFWGCERGTIVFGTLFLTIPTYTFFTLVWHFDSGADKTMEEPNWMIFLNMVTLIMCRCVVISVKYGAFSEVRMAVYRTNYMSVKHLESNLTMVRLISTDVKFRLKL